MPHQPHRLAVIGAGNMGGAVVRGVLRAGVLPPGRLAVCDTDAAKVSALAALGVVTLETPAAALDWLAAAGDNGRLLLAIKPQSLRDLARSVAGHGALRGLVVISILAGVTRDGVARALPGVRVVRAMPNLPASIGMGATAICAGPGIDDGDLAFAGSVFAAIGPLVLPLREELMDAFTAVAGSGPAYLFYLAAAMRDAAVVQGLSPADADAAVRTTLAGAAELLRTSPRSADELRAAVTSKGGTTEAAVRVLDARAVRQAVIDAVAAGTDRARELAEQASGT
ncbi:MAG TPA: pyrroline-5-carboxylate reductase [Phycisphaerales bacterium]|nr:pyrroline-5-carboxylate reductase [Phycisphaerales bacterium]